MNFGTSPVGLPAGATASSTYRYDSSGLRSGKSVTTSPSGEPTTATSTSSWDVSGGLPLLLRDKTGPDATYLLYGPGGQPVEQIGPGGDVLWLHRDQLGSVRLATNTTGTVVSTRTWDAYGNPTTTTGTAKPLLGYAAQTTDPETGYQYLRARYYDPKTTQFLTLDPLIATTGEPYGYAGSNPISRVDPTGQNWLGDAWDATGGKAVTFVNDTCFADARKAATCAAVAAGAVATVATVGAASPAVAAALGGTELLGTVATGAGGVALAIDGGFVANDCVVNRNESCGPSAAAFAVDLASLGMGSRMPGMLGMTGSPQRMRAAVAGSKAMWSVVGFGAQVFLFGMNCDPALSE